MSDYHILEGSKDGNRFTVVFHFPVPNLSNEVGRNYREALIEWLGGSQASRVPFIDGAEQTQLNNGELYEASYPFNTHPGETLAQKQARLDAMYVAEKTGSQAEVEKILSYWGHSRDIP